MRKYTLSVIFILAISLVAVFAVHSQTVNPEMYFGDTARTGIPFSKDPHVIWFKGSYLMYYSVPGYKNSDNKQVGWGIAVAQSGDLIQWKRIGEINSDPAAEYESKGFCAPCAIVIDDKVHLFYQTYGNGKNDAICHAWSVDGINFTRDQSNPVFRPNGEWNCGRAIDAEVIQFNGQYFLYYATRDSAYKIQMVGVAISDNGNLNGKNWRNLSVNGPILKPELPWEKDCIEGASVIEKNGRLYMFYAGAYNNAPQQIGVAVSDDGIQWKRLFAEPFLANGKPGEWNASESGHPHIFNKPNGDDFLFFQGNNSKGKNWFLSNVKVIWKEGMPEIVR